MEADLEACDVEWLATDAVGHVAVLTLAGPGPVPSVFRNWDLLGQVSDAPEALRITTQAQMLVQLKRPDDYIAFAERGLFSYDWTDFHRGSAEHVHHYE